MDTRDTVVAIMHMLPTGSSRRSLFIHYFHRLPHFRNPVTFNEKINWRILYDRRPVLEWTCDKLAMKEYAAKVSGLRVPRTLWTGTNVRELGAARLPEDWVLKPNHRSGQVFFGRGRPDIPLLTAMSEKWLRPLEVEKLHEWAYSKARPLFLAEELLGVPGSPPADYKFFVFNGQVAVMQVHIDRYTAHRNRLYLPDWTPLEVEYGPYPLSPIEPPPENLDKMLELASELARPFDFMRVDLYNIDGDIIFGEITPYPLSGLGVFIPASFDAELGARWRLPAAAS